MATLKEYFDTDFNSTVAICFSPVLRSEDGIIKVPYTCRAHYDFIAHAKYSSFYIPTNPDAVLLCSSLIDFQETPFIATGSRTIQLPSTKLFHGALHFGNLEMPLIKAHLLSEDYKPKLEPEYFTDAEELPYTNHMYLYVEDEVSSPDVAALKQQAKKVGTSVIFRGKRYLMQRALRESPLAFISHDSRDKEKIARPLAIQLTKMMCPVWYDEYSLQVGDSLRESIEKGIRECKKCIVILSPSFLSNNGWTKMEFNSIFTRELIETKKLVLPIWYGVTPQQVYEYSPSLADKVALDWSLGEDEIVRKLYNAILAE